MQKSGLENGSKDSPFSDINTPSVNLRIKVGEKKKKSSRENDSIINKGADVSDLTYSDKNEYNEAFNVINDTLKTISEAQKDIKNDKEGSCNRGKSSVHSNNRIEISSEQHERERACSEGRHSGGGGGTGSKRIQCPMCNFKLKS